MARVCAEPRCPFYANKRGTYCDQHDPRPALYNAAWRKHSQAVRALNPYCVECGAPAVGVDHPTDHPLCASCHQKRERARQRGG